MTTAMFRQAAMAAAFPYHPRHGHRDRVRAPRVEGLPAAAVAVLAAAAGSFCNEALRSAAPGLYQNETQTPQAGR